ncbi:unnamed protein product [Mesocestoides corti]|uniref:RRM domain-containing protein n=1 Tax=Mesocestoides corti TaxID=53468 RepID=A0A0R3U2W4_MESCO|nr:unnamed protein product [Mesocestoides corti]
MLGTGNAVADSTELTELYDDPEHSVSDIKVLFKPLTSQSVHTGKRFATYLGNLTWWTTDVDIFEAFNNIGVKDILEVKFHENRQNGQSKGFCVVVFGSEASVKTGMEKISKIVINGQQPVLTYCTKHNLTIFEKAASNDASAQSSSSGSALLGSGSSNGRLPPPLMSTPALPVSLGFSLLMSGFNLPTSLSTNPGSSLIPTPPLPMPCTSGTNTHINPNFLQQGALTQTGAVGPSSLLQAAQLGASVLRPQLDQFGRPLVQTYTPGLFYFELSGKISEAEFEDIMQKNKTVSSTAINRAVQDAACGNYAGAIETLVTAISLIKQSKIAHDDRCKILINSLQDTLHGIETKSYGSKHHRSDRHRTRSRSPRGARNDDRRHRSSRNEHERSGGRSDRDYYSNGSPGYRESNRYRQ